MKITYSQLQRLIREAFAPTAEGEAKKINDQTGIGLVTDQAFWEKHGVITGEDLAKDILGQTYSDYYKDLHGIRPRWVDMTNMSVDDIQELIDDLDEEAKAMNPPQRDPDWWEDRDKENQPGWSDEMMAAIEVAPNSVPKEYLEYENMPGRSGMGRRTESLMRLTKQQLRKIIKEQLEINQ